VAHHTRNGWVTAADTASDLRFAHPLIDRYAGAAMSALFSPRARHLCWRDLWIALAEAERALGLDVSEAAIAQMKHARERFDWARVAELEKELRHDVMAHVHHFGELAPEARGIIHLGATSCFVTDNGDLMLYRQALEQVEQRLVGALHALRAFAIEHRDRPCLGATHYQPAQPVTLGKRACLWMQDLLFDLDEVRRVRDWLPARGVKGTTGTQASFLALFDGDHDKVRELERKVCRSIGFQRAVAVTGQTYPRKIDWTILSALVGVAQSASKFAADVRLMSHDGELEEPSESKQIGSSAMAYKKNPMRCERVSSLARLVLALGDTAAQTAANQWLERTLDDSAVRRIATPEAFLAIDAILILIANVAGGFVVHERVIERRLRENLPFLATEEILMAGVRAGGDRQHLHEQIRVHSRAAIARVRGEGAENDLFERLAADPAFSGVALDVFTDARRFVGRAPQQVDDFLADEVDPRLAGTSGAGADPSEVRV
jgi:adenylosuccinate lyase